MAPRDWPRPRAPRSPSWAGRGRQGAPPKPSRVEARPPLPRAWPTFSPAPPRAPGGAPGPHPARPPPRAGPLHPPTHRESGVWERKARGCGGRRKMAGRPPSPESQKPAAGSGGPGRPQPARARPPLPSAPSRPVRSGPGGARRGASPAAGPGVGRGGVGAQALSSSASARAQGCGPALRGPASQRGPVRPEGRPPRTGPQLPGPRAH